MSVFLPHPCPRLSHLRCSNHSVWYSRPPNSPHQWQNQLWWRRKCLFIAASYHLWPERIVWKRLLQDQIQKRGTTCDFKRVERPTTHKGGNVYLLERLYYKSHQEHPAPSPPRIKILEDNVQFGFGCDIWYNSWSRIYSSKKHYTHVIYSLWPMYKNKTVFLRYSTLFFVE